MSISLGNIHACLEHQHTKRDARYPADEAYDTEDSEEDKDDGGRVVFLNEVEDSGTDAESNIQDASDPYKLLCKGARHCEIKP